MRSLLLLYSLLSISFYAFAQDQVIKIASGFEGFFPDRTWTNTGTIAFDSSSNNHFSATDSLHPYGIGYKSSFPASLRFQSVEVTVKAKVRAHSAGGKGSLVFSSTRNSQSTFWESRNIVVQQADTGRWIDFTASAAFPSNLTGNECELLIFFWNENGKSQIDIDDVDFVFKVKELPSFFPSFPLSSQNDRKDFFLLTKTRDFSFLTDADSSSLIVLSALGDTLFSDYFLVLEMNSKRNKTTLPLVNPVDLSRNVRRTKMGDGVVIDFKSKDICGTISVTENSAGSSLDFNSSVHFLKEKYVRRLAFALNQQIPLDRVYKVNTQVDSGYFKKEYWLEKEGYSVSNERSKLVTYRPDNLSSIQLGNFGAQVVFNFDFATDHPLMHFPKMSKSKNIYVDQSERNYKAGDSLLSAFRFDLIPVSSEIIRIAKNPNGFPASLVWTEHADYADIRTQRAVNFGSENVVKLKDAKGGFAGWNIPVTKSVFYCNPEAQTLKFKDSRFDRTSVSIKNHPTSKSFSKNLRVAISTFVCIPRIHLPRSLIRWKKL
ncbi:MAG: hypothetical protein IPP51_06315 [Bacteroidetes bacterium]|nr:hypothetical protein [Bacteroidota bacterium]